jgi:hypothetical protein
VTLRRTGALGHWRSWAIQLGPAEVQTRRWERRRVDVIATDVDELAATFEELALER